MESTRTTRSSVSGRLLDRRPSLPEPSLTLGWVTTNRWSAWQSPQNTACISPRMEIQPSELQEKHQKTPSSAHRYRSHSMPSGLPRRKTSKERIIMPKLVTPRDSLHGATQVNLVNQKINQDTPENIIPGLNKKVRRSTQFNKPGAPRIQRAQSFERSTPRITRDQAGTRCRRHSMDLYATPMNQEPWKDIVSSLLQDLPVQDAIHEISFTQVSKDEFPREPLPKGSDVFQTTMWDFQNSGQIGLSEVKKNEQNDSLTGNFKFDSDTPSRKVRWTDQFC